MNPDIRLSITFWKHPKTIKLIRRHGLETARSLQVLGCFAAQEHPSGRFAGMDAGIALPPHARRRDRESSRPTKAIVGKSRGTATGAADIMFDKAFPDFREGAAWTDGRDKRPRGEDEL